MRFSKLVTVAVLVTAFSGLLGIDSAEARRRKTSGDGGSGNTVLEFSFSLVDQDPFGRVIDTCDSNLECLFEGAIEEFSAFFDQTADGGSLSQNPKDDSINNDGFLVDGVSSVFNLRSVNEADGVKYFLETPSGKSLYDEILDNLDDAASMKQFREEFPNSNLEFSWVSSFTVDNIRATSDLGYIIDQLDLSRGNVDPTVSALTALNLSILDSATNDGARVRAKGVITEETKDNKATVPEPATTLGMIIFGVFGLGSSLRKRLSF